MSLRYIERIVAVEREYAAAADAFAFAVANWTEFVAGPSRSDRSLTLTAFIEARQQLDDTYFVRLTAEFESILKQHMRSNHRSVAIRGWKVDYLIKKVRQYEPAVHIDADLNRKLTQVRDYRNDLAHGEGRRAVVTFKTAARTYKQFLRMVPEPKR